MSNITLIALGFSSLFFCNVSALKEINSEDEFNQVIQENPQVVVCFFFRTRTNAQELMNILKEVEKDFPQVFFVSVNSRSSSNLARSYNAFLLRNVLVFFKDRKEVKREVFDLSKMVNKWDIFSIIEGVFSSTEPYEKNEKDEPGQEYTVCEADSDEVG